MFDFFCCTLNITSCKITMHTARNLLIAFRQLIFYKIILTVNSSVQILW